MLLPVLNSCRFTRDPNDFTNASVPHDIVLTVKGEYIECWDGKV